MIWKIFLGALIFAVYVFVGAVVACLLIDEWEDETGLKIVIALAWPLIFIGYLGAKITILPRRIADAIRERIDT